MNMHNTKTMNYVFNVVLHNDSALQNAFRNQSSDLYEQSTDLLSHLIPTKIDSFKSKEHCRVSLRCTQIQKSVHWPIQK